jgi:hypothetical protein
LPISEISVSVPASKHPIHMASSINIGIYPRRTPKDPGHFGAIDPCNEGDARHIWFLAVTGFFVCRFVNADCAKQALSLWATDTVRD